MTARDRRASDHERGRARSIRRPGDGWVECGCGQRHWGLNGAAGLLVWRRARRGGSGLEVLLQLRAEWTHQGGTWGLPGGAVSDGESPAQGALRECEEETGVRPRVLAVVDVGAGERFTFPNGDACVFMDITFVGRADAVQAARVRVADDESTDVGWFRPEDLPSPLAASSRGRIEAALAWLADPTSGARFRS